MLKNIHVEASLNQREHWPNIIAPENSREPIKLNVPTPHLLFIQRELRIIQGLLSLFGLGSINLEDYEINWIPENKDEEESLKIRSWSRNREPIPDEKKPCLSFDLVARAVLAAENAERLDIPLNFFRRGMLDLNQDSYIEAIYDFFFVIETLFADGKFKSASVLDEFRKSEALREAITKSQADPGLILLQTRGASDKFTREIKSLDVDEVISRIVDLRGLLHHHTQKKRARWHPESQEEYACDAIFLQSVAYNVLFDVAGKHIWDQSIVELYLDLCRSHKKNAN